MVTCMVLTSGFDIRQQVTKPIPECSHSVEVDCSKTPERSDCLSDCESKLKCGHKCPLKCRDDCQYAVCDVVTIIEEIQCCDHNLTLTCSESKSKI